MRRASEKYMDRHPISAKLYNKAQKCFPGGDTRTVTFFKPYPFYIDSGEGFQLFDVDGNVYIDFLNNYTSLIHGHAHPAIIKAVSDRVSKGISFSAPNESQIILASMISERVKSVEHIRFCNSGTEATMHAIKAARIFSGKSRVVKIEGAYHGTHDIAEVSVNPTIEAIGTIDKPQSVPKSKGIPKSVCDEVIVIPFNNIEVAEKRIRENHKEIACVIVEPIMGSAGMIMPQEGYLKFLRKLTQELKLLLIFDEIVTFRLALGGAQNIFNVEPDLTTFGKIIGGGFPVGAFGGAKEIMKIFSPIEKGFVSQSGTFNANPITMAAGIECLRMVTFEMIEHINKLGSLLREGIALAFRDIGIRGQATGCGSLGQIHLNSEKIVDYRSILKGNYSAMLLLHLTLLENGIYIAPRGGELAISSPMTENEISAFLAAFRESLVVIKPFVAETSPHLIGE